MKKVRSTKPSPKRLKKKQKATTTTGPPPSPLSVAEVINTQYLTKFDPQSDLFKAYKAGKPFSFVALNDFVKEDFAVGLLEELKNQKWHTKRNDLYTFRQTNDLKKLESPYLLNYRESLYSQTFRDFLESMTGVTLNTTVDVAGQRYRKGGNLLCHDDELDGRRIAFILYLVPKDWSDADGGHFCLYEDDGNREPAADPVLKVLPKWNMALFFETNHNTWHQVSEVLSTKERFSISGWFHGPPLQRPPHVVQAPLPLIPASDFPQDFDLKDWVDPQYLDTEAQTTIRKYFEKNSSIGLPQFLLKEKFESILEALPGADWKTIGPANRRHHGSLGREKGRETGILLQAKNFFRSTAFVSLLHSLTSLKVKNSEEGQYRRFQKQDYTLVHDNEYQHQSFGLDMYMKFQEPDKEWESNHGGYVSYMDSESELLALPPSSNVLHLVYRDEGCMKFVKFLTSDAPCISYDLQNTFITEDNNDDEPDEDEDDDDDDDEDDEEEEDEQLEEAEKKEEEKEKKENSSADIKEKEEHKE